jgi:F-box/leucine-rich repeat protein 14
MPRLRMLMGQGAVAGDDGFAALSRSPTIEYIWGRECPNLAGRGFAALASMPALRGIAVSCKNVDDAALSALPHFPALREFMPMDVPDAGFGHVGRCEYLEGLWCMYCRDTGDAATEHIGGLSRLQTYYAGKTRITDRSLEILGRMPSLERVEFWQCAGLTDAGMAHLAGLPRLREIGLDGLPNVTREAVALFPANVRVSYSA